MTLMQRRRALMGAISRSSWPVVITAPMNQQTLCNNGTITTRQDWRSAGYIQIPSGAIRARLFNTNSSAPQTGRLGAPVIEGQTSGITMIQMSGNVIFSGADINIPNGSNYLYPSRTGTNESAITVEFYND